METLPESLKQPLVELLLATADDKLLLGHLNADWTGLAPLLEEDIAFSSLAQDDLAHAAALYEFIAGLTGDNPNRVAYGRAAHEYRCAAIVTIPDENNWAAAIVRQFLCDHFDFLRLSRLAGSAYTPLRVQAAKMLAEERLALGHADQWVVRLGRGGDDARGRMQAALDRLTPHACMLFEPTAGVAALEEASVYPRRADDMFAAWQTGIENIIEAATLHVTLARHAEGQRGGRSGVHLPGFDAVLAELTEVYRVEPEAVW